MRWYGHILRMNKERIPKQDLNMKSKRKKPKKETEVKNEKWFKKDVTQKEERPWEETEEGLWEDRGGWRGWLSDDACVQWKFLRKKRRRKKKLEIE
jgi:hypothetical protein